MNLILSASTQEKCEQMLNEYFYSTTYKINNDKIMFGGENTNIPIQENTNFAYKKKGKKHQIYTNY